MAVRLAAALGTALRRGDRVVASRASADACRMIQRALISGLTSTGVHVADLRISPAAVTRHVLKTQGLQAGVDVGRSSADPEMINIRVFEWPGNQMTAARQNEVEKHFSRHELRRATFAEVGETTYPARVRESYAQDILDSVDVDSVRRRRFRVAIDYGYSPAAFTLPLVLGPLGVEGLNRNTWVLRRGRYGGGARVVRHATNRDGRSRRPRSRPRPRCRAAAARGRARERCPPSSASCSSSGCSRSPGARAVSQSRSPRRGTSTTSWQGSSLEIVRTQHSLVDLTRAATEDDVVLAAAPTGGFVFPEVVSGGHAVTALCKILELLAGQERPVSELVAELPEADSRPQRPAVPVEPQGTRHAAPQRVPRVRGGSTSRTA